MTDRETFATRLGAVTAMVGVAVGLGNVWRFPYMVGRFGGTAFVLLYVLFALLVGVPALMAEWSLGRHTRRGAVGAFAAAGLPGGRWIGWFLFAAVAAATAYYTNVIGWVVFHGLAELARPVLPDADGGRILPPVEGFRSGSFLLQILFTGGVVLAAVTVLLRGLRAGIERASRILIPVLFAVLLLLILRSLTLPGGAAGLRAYILRFEPGAITPSVALAALGQAVFSLALGGTYMVTYGSYLDARDDLAADALGTVAGDTAAGLLAGLAIFPAVFALGVEPGSGPGLLFSTLPGVFARIPAGWLFGALFFLALAGAAYLSALAAFEVLITALTEGRSLDRRRATWIAAGLVLLLALPPMVNLRVFVPWDLAFGSGLQTFGVFLAVVTVGWALQRDAALAQLGRGAPWLHAWLRFVIPGVIGVLGVWWVVTEVL